MNQTNPVILHVDDDEDDLAILGEALTSVRHSLHVIGANDGREALHILEQSERLPDLIILDINMPGMDGRETLKHLKAHEHWKTIPTVVLSTSSDPRDKAFCQGYAVEMMTKPMEITELRKTAQQLMQYVEG